jgi:hypothetical protein
MAKKKAKAVTTEAPEFSAKGILITIGVIMIALGGLILYH